MIPVFLEILLTDVFSIYYVFSNLETRDTDFGKTLLLTIWNLYLTIPVFTVILLGSKTTEKAQKMAPIIGKLINSCDDHKIIERVNYLHDFEFIIKVLSFVPVEVVFIAIAKSFTCYQLWII